MEKRPHRASIKVRNALQKISLEDLSLFESIAGNDSLAATARALGLRAPYITKALRRLESRLGERLLVRTSTGITLTPKGAEFLELAKQVDRTIDQSLWMASGGAPPRARLLTMLGPTFLLAHLVAPHALRALERQSLGLRLYDVTTGEMASPASRELFELAVHCDPIDWGRSWVSYPVGTLQWVLCGRRNHPVGPRATEKEVLQFPFVLPTTLAADGFRLGKDNCPVSVKERLRLCEVRTSEIGLRAIQGTDQLIFLPEIQAADLIRSGSLQPIEVVDWAPVRRTVFLSAHQDRVTQRSLSVLLRSLESGLALAKK